MQVKRTDSAVIITLSSADAEDIMEVLFQASPERRSALLTAQALSDRLRLTLGISWDALIRRLDR